MKRLVFYLISFLVVVNTYSQQIEKFSIDSGGKSTTNGNLQLLYTIGEVNINEASALNIQLSEGFINPEILLAITISPKVLLQGPYLNPATTGLMNDNLRANDLLPATSPYADGLIADAEVFNTTGTNAIVDWVWIELRDSNDFGIEVIGQSAFLQRDGDVVAVDGTSPVSLSIGEGDYYLVLDHRNHLGVMTLNPISLSTGNPNVFDFRTTSLSTYGTSAQVIMATGDSALWAGDTNITKNIKFSGASNDANPIKDFVLADPDNGFNSITYGSAGYLLIDVDLNGQGKFSGAGNDSNIIKDNVLNHPNNGFGSQTYTIQSTVPPKN